MGERPWVAPGSAPRPEHPAPPSATPPSPGSAGPPPGAFGPPPGSAPPPPGYAAPPPGYAAPPPGYAAPAPGYPQSPPGYAGPPQRYTAPPPGAVAPAYAGLEFRPGIIPLRPLTLGDIFGAVTKAIRGNVAATMGLALVTSLICLVPTTALGAWLASMETTDFMTGDGGGLGLVGSYLPSLGAIVSSVALTGFLAYVVGQAVLGRKVGIGETWDGTKRRLPAVAGAVLVTIVGALVVLGVVLGLPIAWLVLAGGEAGPILLLVLAVFVAIAVYLYLWTRLAFVTAVIVLEGRGVWSAFARSWRLTTGTPFWRILGIRILTAILVGVASNLVTLPITILGIVAVIALGGEDQLFMWQAVLAGVATLISGAITTPFSAGVDALMAVDQRIRREGLDVQLIHAAQRGGPAPWPSAASAR
ncbi:MAG TPA: hypothetical protein VFU25_04010 [Ornithinibacter sp.]|nr:hypothetical protein [Ornithinibacter sp.]